MKRAPHSAASHQPVEQLYAPAALLRMRPRSNGAYRHENNRVYAEAHGVGLVMDIFTPPNPNGLGIVDVVSGAWHSDRVRLNEHIGLGLIDGHCARGYTVFAVSPGSLPLFTAAEMARHVRAAIRHIKAGAAEWAIDPERLGLTGASAGGHLAALAALHPDPAKPQSRLSWKHFGSEVHAAGLFFPPTDFLDYGGAPFPFTRAEGLPVDRLLFADGMERHAAESIAERAAALSPARIVPHSPPPFLLIHGDADPVVPLQQSEALLRALRAAGGEAELLIRPGGGHPWPGIHTEIERLGQWFDRKLRP